ncbi:hypothetical protein CUJ84_Chr004209 [Rhizobium leguminosarum]|uniref:Uncharacterized protein n=1 Tax=Rhizobium leguminosarum TaxID=384 RepID=A0A2K9Z8I5_RHILE|nr:hypothetical protein CUJ84_Chr004209 [Rhizobium leguminosarum]
MGGLTRFLQRLAMTEWKTETRPAYPISPPVGEVSGKTEGLADGPTLKPATSPPNERLKFPANNASRRWETRKRQSGNDHFIRHRWHRHQGWHRSFRDRHRSPRPPPDAQG